MDFCNDANFRGQIADILATNLFGCAPSLVLDWYDKTFIPNRIVMPGLATPSCNINPAIFTLPYLSLFASCKFLGHDLPVWLSNGNDVYDTPICSTSLLSSNHRVMVIGQDPLRTVSTPGNVSIMSPWGLHYPSGFSKHSNVYNNLFTPLLQKGCEIYVTDYWKLFAASYVNPKSTKSAISASRSLIKGAFPSTPNIFDDILKEEIDAFKPQSILILSSDKSKYQPILKAIAGLIPGAVKVSFLPASPATPKSISISISGVGFGGHVTSINKDVVCATHPNGVRGGGKGAFGSFYGAVISML